MTAASILQLRLQNQQLSGSTFKEPEQVVQWMGALQAQEYTSCKWALGLRTPDSTDTLIEQAIDKGSIIRTHVLRPTWHLVHSSDIRWMLALTAPRIHAFNAFGYRQMELTDAIFKKADRVLTKALKGGKHLTRAELQLAFKEAKIKTNDLRFIHILMHAELDAVVCNGARQGKQFTYALLDERIPPAPAFKKEEALMKLTERYFQSHGPATLQDYTWWSGLTAKDAQLGLELVKPGLIPETLEDKTYWMSNKTASVKTTPSAFLLPAFDEYTVAYKDRSLAVNAEAAKLTGNGISKPLLLLNGKVKGIWKRNDKKNQKERADIRPFEKYNAIHTKQIQKEIKRYTQFLNR